jgi:hypothetical protein
MNAVTVSLAKLALFLIPPGPETVTVESRAVILLFGAQRYG